MDPKDDNPEEEPFESSGRTLDADGKLESPAGAPLARLSRISRSRLLQEFELEGRPKAAPLELEAHPVHPESDYVPPRRAARPKPAPGRSPAPWLALLALGALVAGGWYFFLAKPKPAPRAAAVVVFITSDPTGAQVSVEGSPLGVTPWAADNTWPNGPVNVTLTASGHRPWTGTFSGGRPARLEVRLQKR